MCWKTKDIKSTVAPHQCMTCSGEIPAGSPALHVVHIPSVRCSMYDAVRDVDMDCGETGFRAGHLHTDCAYGTDLGEVYDAEA